MRFLLSPRVHAKPGQLIQMAKGVHALVQKAHDINVAVDCAVKNPMVVDRQNLEFWFHGRAAEGFCKMRFNASLILALYFAICDSPQVANV